MGGISQIQISVDTFKIMMKKEKRKTLTEIRKKKCDFALGFCLFVCFRCIKVKQPCSTCISRTRLWTKASAKYLKSKCKCQACHLHSGCSGIVPTTF